MMPFLLPEGMFDCSLQVKFFCPFLKIINRRVTFLHLNDEQIRQRIFKDIFALALLMEIIL